ncbi:hypothetical protein CapIbe_006023 [Capra ibex]
MLTRKIKLWDINAHITCRLCGGYLIDATTVTECLHTFCRSCLVKYLEENNTCPTCRIVIHQSHPLQYIGHDRTMQDIVYKLVPGLQEAEARNQREFYRKLGLEVPGDAKGEACSAKQRLDPHRDGETKADDSSNKEAAEEKQEEDGDYHRSDEQVSICLECNSSKLRGLKRKWIRCSAQATVLHLKKFIAKKLNLSSFNEKEGRWLFPDRRDCLHQRPRVLSTEPSAPLTEVWFFRQLDILCNEEILGKDHTLKFVVVTRWRFKTVVWNVWRQERGGGPSGCELVPAACLSPCTSSGFCLRFGLFPAVPLAPRGPGATSFNARTPRQTHPPSLDPLPHVAPSAVPLDAGFIELVWCLAPEVIAEPGLRSLRYAAASHCSCLHGTVCMRTRFKGGADGRLHLELWQDARLCSEKRASPDFTAGAVPSKAAILS